MNRSNNLFPQNHSNSAAQTDNTKNSDSRLVVRTLLIMETIAYNANPLGINQLAKLTGLNTTTAFRICKTLCNYGWLTQDSAGRYYIGINAYLVGKKYNIYDDLVLVSAEPMKTLAKNVKQPVNLMAVKGTDCYLINQIMGNRGFSGLSPNGSSRPMHIVAAGKAILSTYEDKQLEIMLDSFDYYPYTPNSVTNKEDLRKQILQAREDGYATEYQESNWGCCCVAVPVFNEHNMVCAALSISMITEYASFTKLYAEKLLETSKKITLQLAEYHAGKK